MENLLEKWEVPQEVIKNFTDNCIELDQLKDILEGGDLLKELCPAIGLRIKIKNKIQEHLSSMTDTVTISTTCDDILTDIDVDRLNDFDIDNLLIKPKLPHFELKTLLTTSPCGKAILKSYEVNKSLNSKHRNQLTDIIIRHIFTYIANNHITYEDYNVIAAKIITLFPAESTGTYFVPAIKKRDSISGKPVFAKGKLVDKVRNILYKSGERKRNVGDKENDIPAKNLKLVQDLKEINEEKTAWLSNNTEPWEQVILYWTETYDLRRSIDYKTVAHFVQEWNILNDVRGESLINIDFDKKYPNTNANFFLNWNNFIEKVIKLKEAHIKDEGILNDLEDLKQETEVDKKAIKQLKLLCRLIPPKGRLNKKIKFSTLECIEGIVVNVTEPGDIQQAIETQAKRAKTNKVTVQPYIVACESSRAYYLVIDIIKYKFTSATKALDTLFKCYHTFHASYPKASDHIYLVIQRGVYGIKTKYDNVVPYITDILALD